MAKSTDRPILHCLPGFLGQAADFQALLSSSLDSRMLRHSELQTDATRGKTLAERGAFLNSSLKVEGKAEGKAGEILLGYSLGGRIALHALTQNPNHWKGAIIISSNPGLVNPGERLARIALDRIWAERFLVENWSTLLRDWDLQPVFAGVPFMDTNLGVEDFRPQVSRQDCADLLVSCSLGLQEDLRPKIAALKLPILWISGQLDAKYSQIGAEMAQLNSNIRSVFVEGAGHRIPWKQLQRVVSTFW